jgi:hypothetical protein
MPIIKPTPWCIQTTTSSIPNAFTPHKVDREGGENPLRRREPKQVREGGENLRRREPQQAQEGGENPCLAFTPAMTKKSAPCIHTTASPIGRREQQVFRVVSSIGVFLRSRGFHCYLIWKNTTCILQVCRNNITQADNNIMSDPRHVCVLVFGIVNFYVKFSRT